MRPAAVGGHAGRRRIGSWTTRTGAPKGDQRSIFALHDRLTAYGISHEDPARARAWRWATGRSTLRAVERPPPQAGRRREERADQARGRRPPKAGAGADLSMEVSRRLSPPPVRLSVSSVSGYFSLSQLPPPAYSSHPTVQALRQIPQVTTRRRSTPWFRERRVSRGRALQTVVGGIAQKARQGGRFGGDPTFVLRSKICPRPHHAILTSDGAHSPLFELSSL